MASLFDNYIIEFQSQNLMNLQRIYFPSSIDNDLCGRYANVELSNGKVFLSRIFIKPILRENYCFMDESVLYENKSKDNIASDMCIRIKNVNLIESVDNIESIIISVVLKNVEEREEWTRSQRKRHLIKGALRLFVHAENTIVILKDIKEFDKFGIHSILVHSIGNLKAGKVDDKTQVSIKKLISFERYEQLSQVNDSGIDGFEKPYQALKEFIICRKLMSTSEFSKKYNLPQVLLIGPGGCGKKFILRKVAYDCNAVLMTVDCTELNKPEPTKIESTALNNKFENAILHSREGLVILLFIYSETICKRPGKLLNEFNALLDQVSLKSNIVVVATTTSISLLHESIKSSSRFHYHIYFDIPNEEERGKMLSMICKGEGLPNESCSEIAKITPGYIISDLVLLVSRTSRELKQSTTKDETISDDLVFTTLKKHVTLTEPSTLRGELGVVKTNNLLTVTLGGLFTVKNLIYQAIQWPLKNGAAFKRLNLKQPSGVLMYGPPGCAKTSLARSIASQSNVTFLSVSAADLYSPYVGDAERAITNLFQKARAAAPTILFIDEIDALVGARGGGRQKGVQERILSTFLIEMDGISGQELLTMESDCQNKVIVIAATNRPQVLDSAILRPGRLDKLIYVPPPDVVDRKDILEILTKGMPLENCDLDYLSLNTELFSGADLANLCREAALKAMVDCGVDCKVIKQEHWLSALSDITPSLTKEQIRWFDTFSFSLGKEDYT